MKVMELALECVRGLSPYLPGKPTSELERELGLKNIIKLASNENPLGPSPKALAAAQRALGEIHLYPDGGGFALKQAIARRHDLDPSGVTLGNGSNDVLELIARAFLGKGRSAAFCEHAFAVYPIVSAAAGATLRIASAHDGSRGPRYGHNLDALADCLDETTRVVFIANPNNPTGTYLSSDVLQAFLERVPKTALVVIDEAYFEYVACADYPDVSTWLTMDPRLIVTRTFSKAYGLAGLRVGYALSSPEVSDLLNRVRQPFNVNLPAMEAACAALDDEAHLTRTVLLNQKELPAMQAALSARGFEVIPSVGNFVAFDVGRPAQEIYQALLKEGVIVRPIANYGLPRHLRVTLGLEQENQAFLLALDRVMDQ